MKDISNTVIYTDIPMYVGICINIHKIIHLLVSNN